MDVEQGFKEALASWASGVSVVAVRGADGLAYALTVSSFASVSLRPPLISVCVQNENRLPSMVGAAGGFAVSILAWGQQDTSAVFATKGREPAPRLEVPTRDTPEGHPVVEGAAAWVGCTLVSLHVEGDHTLIVGRVVATGADPARQPLLYYRRAYHTLGS